MTSHAAYSYKEERQIYIFLLQKLRYEITHPCLALPHLSCKCPAIVAKVAPIGTPIASFPTPALCAAAELAAPATRAASGSSAWPTVVMVERAVGARLASVWKDTRGVPGGSGWERMNARRCSYVRSSRARSSPCVVWRLWYEASY